MQHDHAGRLRPRGRARAERSDRGRPCRLVGFQLGWNFRTRGKRAKVTFALSLFLAGLLLNRVARVFLSHAGPDKLVVRRIAAALRAAGHDTWVDEDDILVGESIPAAVERGLHDADFVILCMSRVAAERGWIEAERDATLMQQFRERKERILPVRLEEVTPPGLVRPLAHVDLFPDEQAFHQGIARLTRSIAAYTARQPAKDEANAVSSEAAPVRTSTAPATSGAVSTGRPAARIVAPPTPAYLNAEVQALSEQLERVRQRKQRLRDAGIETDDVDREILGLRRQLREGGQLRAGDALGDGRYLLVTSVGRGGFAVVWEAFDHARQQRVAIKVLHQHLAGDPQCKARFFRGARVMMDLKYPAVVRILDPRGEDEGFCYFVMDLVPGGNLQEEVLAQRVKPGDVLRFILQVGAALALAHARDMVHRDVKPANILLDENRNAKLTDFDLVAQRREAPARGVPRCGPAREPPRLPRVPAGWRSGCAPVSSKQASRGAESWSAHSDRNHDSIDSMDCQRCDRQAGV